QGGRKVRTTPPHGWGERWGSLAATAGRQEPEFVAATDGSPASVHSELCVDALRVGSHRAQPHDQLRRDTRAIKVRGQKAQDLEFSSAERLDEALASGRKGTGASQRLKQTPNVARRDAPPRREAQQVSHPRTLGHERPNV